MGNEPRGHSNDNKLRKQKDGQVAHGPFPGGPQQPPPEPSAASWCPNSGGTRSTSTRGPPSQKPCIVGAYDKFPERN